MAFFYVIFFSIYYIKYISDVRLFITEILYFYMVSLNINRNYYSEFKSLILLYQKINLTIL